MNQENSRSMVENDAMMSKDMEEICVMNEKS